MDRQDRFRGALLGLAVGDAVGTAVEFRRRGTFEPVTDMTGGGPFNLAAGQWTDDTSMTLCLATSLLECQGFDPRDQMERYCRWRDTGYLSSTGSCLDIGGTVAAALTRFRETGEPFAGSEDPHTAGNGGLMRLAHHPRGGRVRRRGQPLGRRRRSRPRLVHQRHQLRRELRQQVHR